MAAHTLLLVRHAKSDWAAGAPDHERPLNDRGRREAPELGRALEADDLRPDLVVCSDATRAVDTWNLAATAFGDQPPVQVTPGLYDTSRSGVLDIVAETPESVGILACVGHEPTGSALAALLTGEADPVAAQALSAGLKTACAAVLRFDGTWATLEPGACRLVAVVSPR